MWQLHFFATSWLNCHISHVQVMRIPRGKHVCIQQHLQTFHANSWTLHVVVLLFRRIRDSFRRGHNFIHYQTWDQALVFICLIFFCCWIEAAVAWRWCKSVIQTTGEKWSSNREGRSLKRWIMKQRFCKTQWDIMYYTLRCISSSEILNTESNYKHNICIGIPFPSMQIPGLCFSFRVLHFLCRPPAVSARHNQSPAWTESHLVHIDQTD